MPGVAATLLPDTPDSLLRTPPARRAAPRQEQMRDFGDTRLTRQFIYDDVLKAVQEIEPLSNERHMLRLSNVNYIDPEKWTRKQQKQALLAGETVARRLRGTWELVDNTTGKVIDQRTQVVARVPFYTHRGTLIHRGNEYTLNLQQRLRPGIYTRLKDNGELEAHANILPGHGVSHRYMLDPAKGVFQIKLGQAVMPLMPLLQAMGATDREFREAWGDKLYSANYQKNDASALRKLRLKLLRREDLEDPVEDSQRRKLVAAVERMELDPEVMKRTLGQPYERLNKDVILAVTRKLLAVSKGEADVDDRDHLAYQVFLGPEDLMAERVRRDHGGIRRRIFRKISALGHLAAMPSGLVTPQLEQALIGSGLGQALEEINPAEIFDKQWRITRMGEGGIPSIEAIPDEARGVQPSHFGFYDPIRTPESLRAGVDVYLARNARKGRDGRLYGQFRDVRSGNLVWKTPQDVTDESVAFPGVLKSWDAKRVPVMKSGAIAYVPRAEVAYELPVFEDAFSPLGNLVPLKSAVKQHRVAMASRMLTQALPLVNPEAPLVQSGVPGSQGQRSFEEEYGRHLGAVRADKPGRVVDVRDGVMQLSFDDGTTDEVELYENFPFARKTYLNQTALLRPGERFIAGQPLVRSNYTDEQGATALGLNARVAYVPWKGYNFEDAVVVSEGMAKRLSSEHMYREDLEVDDKTRLGTKAYISLFPQRFDRQTLSRLDERGVIRQGETVEYGQPLILAARERAQPLNKVHKQRQAGFQDHAVIWKHHDPGLVTDVAWSKNGPVVLVKSTAPMQVGDKLSGRYGDKGVVSAIIPDAQMPHDAHGEPFEILLNPNSIQSRTNPAQLIEARLGAIAALRKQPYKIADFGDLDDLSEYALGELRRYGLPDTEEIVDPEIGRKIPGVITGRRFFMKLHHTAEGKAQGRSGGGYTAEDAPAKGGEMGCFVGSVMVRTRSGWESIRRLVHRQSMAEVASRDPKSHAFCWQKLVDWFHYRVDPSELIEVELDNGLVLPVTRGHEFYLANGERRIAGDLRPGDQLVRCEQ